MVVKNLLRRRIRTALSVMGVTIGIAAIVAFSSIGDGFKTSLNRYFAESEAQLLVFSKDVRDIAHSRVSQEDKRRILALPGVVEVSETTFYVANPAGLLTRGSVPAMLLFGRTPGDRLVRKYKNKDFRGELFRAEDEAMLGFLSAENLGKAPGDTIKLMDREFRISAVFKSAASWENGGMVVHNSVLRGKLKMGDSFSLGFVYLADTAEADRVADEIESALPQLAAIRATEFTTYFDQLEYIDWFVWIVSLVSVIVGGLGVLNTMLMSVSERVREIGTLRAVGWSRAMVLRLILSEGLLIAAVGGLVGMAAGWAGAEVLIRIAPPGGFITTEYTAALFAKAGVVAMALGIVGSLYPAWQASRLSPIEALKYE